MGGEFSGWRGRLHFTWACGAGKGAFSPACVLWSGEPMLASALTALLSI